MYLIYFNNNTIFRYFVKLNLIRRFTVEKKLFSLEKKNVGIIIFVDPNVFRFSKNTP